MHKSVAKVLCIGLNLMLGRLDQAEKVTGEPFTEPEILVPHLESKRYGWTHYGVMIPNLPEPHRFLSVMSLVGQTGSLAFDNDHALPTDPRRTASVVAGTAASHPAHFGMYAFGRDFTAAADGSDVRFGDDLRLSGGYPDYQLTGELGGVTVDLQLHTRDTVTWFFRLPFYKHLSLLTDYCGTIDDLEVSGICSVEYGACPSPYVVKSTPLPRAAKAPLDYFVYHVVNLDADNQMLMSQYSIGGVPLFTTAFHRTTAGLSRSFPDVRFTVTEPRPEPEPTPYGRPMVVPRRTRFEVRDTSGELWLDLHTEMDTPFTYGLGSGFVSGFAHESTWRGSPISGRGYVEYIDRRQG